MITHDSILLNETVYFQFCSESAIENKLDIIQVLFQERANITNFKIFEDIFQEAIMPLYNCLIKCKYNTLELHHSLEVGGLGEEWNNWLDYPLEDFEKTENNIFQCYEIWSIREFQTWAYNRSGRSYLEISPNYKWHHIEPLKEEKYMTFKEFQQHYRPIVIELSFVQIENILEHLERIKNDFNIF